MEWVAISFSNAWKWKLKVKSLSRVRLLVTPWTAAYQAPLSMDFSRQECWSGVPLPSPHLYAAGIKFSSVQFLSHSVVSDCNPVDCSTPGFPALHQLLELAQTCVHRVGDAIQSSHPLSSPSPPALSLSQYQGLFRWVSSSYQVAIF